MAQVPYTGAPTQVLQDTPTPEMKPNIPAAAFGGEVAQAMSGFGKTLEGVGDEIFNRALALQNLNNETEAKEKAADFQIEVGKLHAEYSAKSGKDAVDSFQPYIESIKALRGKMRDSLSTSMSQKMFDSDSLSTMGRTIFNGAGHAASSNKQYVAGASAARVDALGEGVYQNPDTNTTKAAIRDTEKEVRETQAPLAGWSPEVTDQKVQEAKSAIVAKQIKGLATKKPFEAAKLLDANKANLTDADYAKVDATVRASGRAVGSANIANEVYEAGKGSKDKPGKSMSVMEAEVRQKAKDFDPDDPILQQHAVQALNQRANQDRYSQAQENQANTSVINQALHDGVFDYQTFRADPRNAAAEDALVAAGKKMNLPADINNYNTARDRKDNMERFNTLMGTANNDTEGFLNYDARSDKKLSQGQINQIIAKQEQLKKNQNQDPRVDRAMGWMRGGFGSQMEALGVYKRSNSNKDDYDHLTGAVQAALDIWQENHGKPPTYKEFEEQIGPQVIQQRSEPGLLWGTNKKPFFNQPTPTDFAEKVKAEVIAKGGVEPTDEELNKAYIRTQLLKLYPGKKASE